MFKKGPVFVSFVFVCLSVSFLFPLSSVLKPICCSFFVCLYDEPSSPSDRCRSGYQSAVEKEEPLTLSPFVYLHSVLGFRVRLSHDGLVSLSRPLCLSVSVSPFALSLGLPFPARVAAAAV